MRCLAKMLAADQSNAIFFNRGPVFHLRLLFQARALAEGVRAGLYVSSEIALGSIKPIYHLVNPNSLILIFKDTGRNYYKIIPRNNYFCNICLIIF